MNTLEVKVWMLKNGIKQADIARDLQRSIALVCLTINGHQRNRRTIRWLLDHGCPENLLEPQDKKAA